MSAKRDAAATSPRIATSSAGTTTVDKIPSCAMTGEAEPRSTTADLEAAATEYETLLNGWWESLRTSSSSAAAAAADGENPTAKDAAEEMCVYIERIVGEEGVECESDDGARADGDGRGGGPEDESTEIDSEARGRDRCDRSDRLPGNALREIDELCLKADVALDSHAPSDASSADVAAFESKSGPGSALASKQADASAVQANVAAALRLWTRAFTLLPKDRFFLYPSRSGYILMGAADALRRVAVASASLRDRDRYLAKALHSLRLAMFIPGTIGTPYAHYLTGVVKLELGGDEKGAEMELGRALYLVDGDEEGELFRNYGDENNGGEGEGNGTGSKSTKAKVLELARSGMVALMEEEERWTASQKQDNGEDEEKEEGA